MKPFVVAIVAVLTNGMLAQAPADSLVGTWKLISQQSSDGSSEFGGNAIGQLMYDTGGNMAVQLLRVNVPRFVSNDRRRGTPEEIRAAFDGTMSYFGRYTVDNTRRSVTHHLVGLSFPHWIGTEQKRFYRLEGRRLILTSEPFVVGGRAITSTLTCERIERPRSIDSRSDRAPTRSLAYLRAGD